jgi:hypothetical protein
MNPLVNAILTQLIAQAKELGLEYFDKGAQLALDAAKGEVADADILAWLRTRAEGPS